MHNQELRENEKDLFFRWKEEFKIIKDPIDKMYLSNEPNDKQKKAFVSYDELLKIREKLPEGSFQRLLLYMYTSIPPVRSDYYKTKIYKKKPSSDVSETNYIVMVTKPYLVLNKYKTAKTYKTIIIDIPDDLKKEIEKSLEKYPRDYLFVSTQNNLPYKNENTFNKWANRSLKSILNKDGFSLTMLRHIFVSRPDLKLNEKTGLEQQKIASKMGHNVSTQKKYMWMREVNDEDL